MRWNRDLPGTQGLRIAGYLLCLLPAAATFNSWSLLFYYCWLGLVVMPCGIKLAGFIPAHIVCIDCLISFIGNMRVI